MDAGRGVAATAQALKSEVEKLDVEITEIRDVLKDLRQRQLCVARITRAERMDKAAQEFAAVAARLEASMGLRASARDKADALSMEPLLAVWLTASQICTAMLSTHNRITNRGTPKVFRVTGITVICI